MTAPRWTSMQWLAALVRVGAGQVVAQGHRIPDEVSQLLAAIESADQFDDKLSHSGPNSASPVEVVDVIGNRDPVTGSAELQLLTRAEVAGLAGVSQRTVSRWNLPRVGSRYVAKAVHEFLEGH